MEATSAVEYKELLILYERFITLCGVVEAYRNVTKSLKLCRKLVKIEKTKLKKSKTPLTLGDTNTVLWLYDDFLSIIKQLSHSKSANIFNKASHDLDSLIDKVNETIKELQQKLGMEHATEYGKRIITTLTDIGKIEPGPLGGSAFIVDGDAAATITELKNLFAGDAN